MLTQANRKLWLEYIKAVRTQDTVFEQQVFRDLIKNKSQELQNTNFIDRLEHFIISTVKPSLRMVDMDFEKQQQEFKLKFMSRRNDEIIFSFLFHIQGTKVVFVKAESEMLDGDINSINQPNITHIGQTIASALSKQQNMEILNIENELDQELNRGF